MIIIDKIRKSIEKQKLEFVELKGKGHPDTMCDDICEIASNALSKYYIKRFGRVLHHNVDKCLLIAGQAKPGFRIGRIKKPIKIIIAGRATSKVGKVKVPVHNIIGVSVRKYLKQFRWAKFKLVIDVQQGASNLTSVPKKRVANDTSIGCAHYSFSKLEQLVLDVNKFIKKLSVSEKAIGKDIKIMGIREKKSINLIIAIAFIGKYVKNIGDYVNIKNKIRKKIEKKFKIDVEINTLDNYNDLSSLYLTVSGLSAENGDDGNAGRGNRYNYLITPSRPMSIESFAGKNIYHPGRTYQVAAHKIAQNVAKLGRKQVEVQIVSEIGKPLSEPKAVYVRVLGRKKGIKEIVEKHLKRLK